MGSLWVIQVGQNIVNILIIDTLKRMHTHTEEFM